MDGKRFEELLVRWEDEGLSEEESAQVAEYLERHPEARDAFVAHFQISEGIAGFMADREAGTDARRARRQRAAAPGVFRTRLVWAAVAACLAIAVWWHLRWGYPPGGPFGKPIARVVKMHPDVRIGRNGDEIACPAGSEIQWGDNIETAADQSATFEYVDDKTRVRVLPESVAELAGTNENTVFLTMGGVDVTASPQPEGLRFVVVSRHALCRVKGTVFSVLVSGRKTRLEVKEGVVEIERRSDGKKLDVAAGHYAVAGTGVELAALPFSRPRGRRTFTAGKVLFEDDFENDLSKWRVEGDPDGTFVRVERVHRDGVTSGVAVMDTSSLTDPEQEVRMKVSVPFAEDCVGLVMEYDSRVKARSSDGEDVPKERLGKWEHYVKQTLFLRDGDTGRIRGIEIREYRDDRIVRQERAELHPDFPRELKISFSTSDGGIQMVDNVRMRYLVAAAEGAAVAGKPFADTKYAEGRTILEDDFSRGTAKWKVPLKNYEKETLFESEEEAAGHISTAEVSREGVKASVLVVDSRNMADRWVHARTRKPIPVRAYVMECRAMVREAYTGSAESDMGVLSTDFVKGSGKKIHSDPKVTASQVGKWVTFRREHVAVPTADGLLEIHSRFFWDGKLYLWETRLCQAGAPWYLDLCVKNGRALVDRVTVRELVPIHGEER